MKEIAPQKIVLIGPMGVGKTTIGKLLAHKLGWPYVDNDSEMSALTGLTREQLAGLPVDELHRYESQGLQNLCASAAPFIGGAAASVVDDPNNRELLKTVASIYLRIPLHEVVARAGSEGIGRGNISGDLKEVLLTRFQRRDPLYKEVAMYVVELNEVPSQAAQKILTFLQGR